ncbi:MAG: hypothetical protein ACAH81_11255 [Actinomycetota bacterium]
MHPADRHPHIANLRVLDVYRLALRLYRLEPARVAGAALALMVPPVVLGIGSGRLIDELRDGPLDDRVVLLLVIAVVAGVLSSIGTIVYAGVLDELVGSVVRDDRRPSISEVVHALPIGRLIGADVLVTVLIAPASALGAVPGFVLLTLLAIVGPVVNIENARPFPAIVRSFRLTARHLWLTMLAVGLPLLIEVGVHHWLLHLRVEADVLTEIAVSVPMILTVGAFVGLVEVELAYALLARDDGSSVAEVVASTAPPE